MYTVCYLFRMKDNETNINPEKGVTWSDFQTAVKQSSESEEETSDGEETAESSNQSEEDNPKPAVIRFSHTVHGEQPQVRVTLLMFGNTCTLLAYQDAYIDNKIISDHKISFKNL